MQKLFILKSQQQNICETNTSKINAIPYVTAEKYNLNIDYEKSLARGYKTFIIFDKASTETAVEAVETLVEETEEEVVGTTEETTTQDTEVKATKRGTRKTTTTTTK